MANDSLIKRLIKDEAGATAIEYGLIASLIVIVIIASLNAFSTATIAMFGLISAAM